MIFLHCKSKQIFNISQVFLLKFQRKFCLHCGSLHLENLAPDKGNLPLHSHHCLHRHSAVHDLDAGMSGAWRVMAVLARGGGRRLRTEQAPEGEVVPQGILHMANVSIDLPQTVLDFFVRMMLVVKGV